MSFFGGLKKALGWSGDNEEDEDYITYDSSSDEQPLAGNKDVVVEFSNPDEIPDGVFDGLIDIINSNLSPMVLKCLDVEAEKKYLYEALGPKFSAFVKETRDKSLSVARAEWEREKTEMNGKIEDFKARCDNAENEMKEMKAVKMSEDRQKSALKERIRGLEDKVAAAEAEKEQYDLENKSLLNKLKVSQVRNDANEEAEKEIQELTAQVVALRKKLAEGGADDERVKQLEEEYKSKMEINNALMNEIRNEAAKSKEALGVKEAELADLNAKLVEAEAKATELEQKNVELESKSAEALDELAKAKSELETAKNELAEVSENQDLLDDIQEQLTKVEDFKKKKEEEIATLNEKVLVLEQEKAKAVEAVRDEEILKGRIAELELELSSCNEKITALSQENTDTLEMLHKRNELVDEQKAELETGKVELEKLRTSFDSLSSAYEALKLSHETETNALKTADVEKTAKFQAEIAELQAKLSVNGKIDDFLVDEDLRQAVEETFNVELDETGFEDFATPVVNEEKTEEKTVETADEAVSDVEAELDDIDWLLPDTADSVIKEEATRKERETREEQERLEAEKPAEPSDAQMSLFG